MFIEETVKRTEVCHQADIVIVGASSTGVCDAVRAARLGMTVALVEVSGRCGGVAVNSLVNVWHSLFDETGEKKIIGGLGEEIMQRLKKRHAVIDQGHTDYWQFCFNSNELACELDELVSEHDNIRLFLHTRVVAAQADDGRVNSVIIEDVDGRRAITA